MNDDSAVSKIFIPYHHLSEITLQPSNSSKKSMSLGGPLWSFSCRWRFLGNTSSTPSPDKWKYLSSTICKTKKSDFSYSRADTIIQILGEPNHISNVHIWFKLSPVTCTQYISATFLFLWPVLCKCTIWVNGLPGHKYRDLIHMNICNQTLYSLTTAAKASSFLCWEDLLRPLKELLKS